jgi:hypothetical protein
VTCNISRAGSRIKSQEISEIGQSFLRMIRNLGWLPMVGFEMVEGEVALTSSFICVNPRFKLLQLAFKPQQKSSGRAGIKFGWHGTANLPKVSSTSATFASSIR